MLFRAAGRFHLADVRVRKDDEAKEQVLEGADELRVGEAFFIIQDESADAAERAEIREHGTRHVGAAIEVVGQPPREQQIADAARE